ncbi:MAG: lysophospholipid acyltransferase family protein [Erythrobacter sp.]|uniref:lysophospholipid acyltransferase family protein n=1 Tax=Erythrobacter sp. TaxID=1042 RepID=UPI003C7254EF
MTNAVTILRNLAFYPAFYGVSIVLVVLSLFAALFGYEPLRRVVEAWSNWHRWCARHLLNIRIVFDGSIPLEPVLYVVKHESFFEAIEAPIVFGMPAVFAKRELFDIPGWGRSARLYGLIPVARDKGARALREMIATARQRVGEGRPLVIFPEGTRVRHGDTPDLQAGFAGIYKLLGLPVVPIAVDSGPFYHRAWKRAGTITYRIGERIPAGLTRDEAEKQVHRAINALNREQRQGALTGGSTSE